MSIRLRLTLLYSGILALTLIALSLILYMTTSRITLDTLQKTLADSAQSVVYARPFSLNRPDDDRHRFAAPATYFQVRAPDGSILNRSTNLGDFDLPLSAEGLAAVQHGATWTEIASADVDRLLVYSRPLVNEGQLMGIVQLARSLADYDQTLNTLRNILIVGGLVVTVLAFGAGWVIAGAALRPIHRITDTAQAIGTHRDFERRVNYTGPTDEVGQLAITFNTMLDELQDAYRQTEQALQAQRRLVTDASHELRTPLTTIRGNLGLLERRPPIDDEDKTAVLTDLVDETNRLIRLTNDLLVLARSDAGRPLRSESIDLQPLIDDTCRQANLLGTARTIVCENDLAATLIGDRDAIKQVLLILLDNALKFTPAGGTITIGTALADRLVAIRIADTGSGIEPEALPHIFERFYRADMSRTGEGAGLGLAIAKELIEAQHGRITVESVVGKGSTFTVTLPQAE